MVEANKTTQTIHHTQTEMWDGTGYTTDVKPDTLLDQETFIEEVRESHMWRKQEHDVPTNWDKNVGGAAKDFSDDLGITKVSDSEEFAERHNLPKELPSELKKKAADQAK